jgi:hypothetical protein
LGENNQTTASRGFSEAQEFLLEKTDIQEYLVKHLIEKVRGPGNVAKERSAPNGSAVTSRSMALLLSGLLIGDTPQAIADGLPHLVQLTPNEGSAQHVGNLEFKGLVDGWWNHSFIDVISLIIDAWRRDTNFVFDNSGFSVIRNPVIYGRIYWNILPYERDEFLIYENKTNQKKAKTVKSHRRIHASFDGDILMVAADWLEGREGH